MKIALGIAFHNRIEKLKRLLNSILENNTKEIDIDTYVICDNEEDMDNLLNLSKKYHLSLLYDEESKYVVKKWNYFYELAFNIKTIGYINLVDDVELYPNTIEEAIKCLLTNYQDTDGIVGFNQECPGHPEYTFVPTGQTLVGHKFLERYKTQNYQMCNPFLVQWFQDNESFHYASKLNKFAFCKEATLKHYHPCFLPNEKDITHDLIRGKIMKEDKKIYLDRQKRGKIWGESWDF